MKSAPEAEGPSATNSLPFLRFHVRNPPNTKAPAIENLPFDVWDSFLSRIHQVASQQHDRIDIFTVIAVLALMAVHLYLVFATNMRHVLLFGVTFAVLFLLLACHTYVKKYDFESLQNVCKEQESTLASYGITIECHDEVGPTNGRPNGHYVYLLKSIAPSSDGTPTTAAAVGAMQHGDHLQVELAKDSLCGWHISPSLDYYDYLPSGMESIPLDVWSELWSQMDAIANRYTVHRRRLCTILTLWLIISTTGTLWNDTVYFVTCLVLLAFLFYGFYCLSVIVSIDAEIERVRGDYAARLQDHGIYIEYRKEHVWTWKRSLLHGDAVGRFLYLYRVTPQSERLDVLSA